MSNCAQLTSELDIQGNAIIPSLLSADECQHLIDICDGADAFNARPLLPAGEPGSGEKRFFDLPLPEPVRALRQSLYEQLVPIANRWNEAMGVDVRYPDQLNTLLEQCYRAGQTRSLSALSRYGAGDYEALHQDSDGDLVFPLQAVILLSEPGNDFSGGEFVMIEQRPRMQSRPMALTLRQGDAVVLALHHRPFQGAHGMYRVNLKHGVSRVRSGQRHALDIVFHDAPQATGLNARH
jgi:hypothetical protein